MPSAAPPTAPANSAPPANQLDMGAISPADAAWLRERGAADVRVGADGVIEFSARPLPVALAAAARDLLPRRTGAGRAIAVGVLTLK